MTSPWPPASDSTRSLSGAELLQLSKLHQQTVEARDLMMALDEAGRDEDLPHYVLVPNSEMMVGALTAEAQRLEEVLAPYLDARVHPPAPPSPVSPLSPQSE